MEATCLFPSDECGGGGSADAPPPAPSPAEMRVKHHINALLTEHLIDIARMFNGGLEQMLILAVLGRMTLAARLSGTWAPPAPPPSVSASKLSEMTAISRQTVRRKLLDMKAKGWLEQDHRRAWMLVMKDGA